MNPNETKNRNGGEPTAGFSTVPIWLVLVFGAIFYWGQFYLDRHAGGFDERVYAPFHSMEEVVAANPVSDADVFLAIGKAKFEGTCAACHQITGLGKEGTAPPLVGSEWVLAPGPNRIERIVLNGLSGPITVKGQVWSLAMPPWRDNFSDKEIAAILSYVRSSWGNKATPVTADQIKKARAEAHPSPMGGEDELKKIPEL